MSYKTLPIGIFTTINFSGDLKMSSEFRGYNESQQFLLVKRCRSGKYLLCDSEGKLIILNKYNITYFVKLREEKFKESEEIQCNVGNIEDQFAE
jgi:hypothetical protein